MIHFFYLPAEQNRQPKGPRGRSSSSFRPRFPHYLDPSEPFSRSTGCLHDLLPIPKATTTVHSTSTPLRLYQVHNGFDPLRASALICPAIRSHLSRRRCHHHQPINKLFALAILLSSHHFDKTAIVKDGSSPLEGMAGGADAITCTPHRVYGFLMEGHYQPGSSRRGARPISCGMVWRFQED